MRQIVHAITPGDHYSPRTGSAIPTVVHGIAAASAHDVRVPRYVHHVLLDRSTFLPRYQSASVIEYTANPPPTRQERLRDIALARVGRPREAARRYYRPLAERMADLPPAIVLAHNAVPLVELLHDSPHTVVLYAHNDILKTIGRREAVRALESVAAIVCVSEALAGQIRARLPASLTDRVRVVHNGVDVEWFLPAVERAPAPRLRVVFIGRMIRDKGADLLVRAASRLRRDDIEFVIVGSRNFDRNAELSRFERRLRRQAASSGSLVTFEPFVDRAEVPRLLQSADILVVPSRWREPSALTITEGMASGLPVIANRVGGIPEVMGSAGILIPNEDPTALAGAIARLADDGALRARAAQASRRHAESRSWSWAWGNLRNVLESLG